MINVNNYLIIPKYKQVCLT